MSATERCRGGFPSCWPRVRVPPTASQSPGSGGVFVFRTDAGQAPGCTRGQLRCRKPIRGTTKEARLRGPQSICRSGAGGSRLLLLHLRGEVPCNALQLCGPAFAALVVPKRTANDLGEVEAPSRGTLGA